MNVVKILVHYPDNPQRWISFYLPFENDATDEAKLDIVWKFMNRYDEPRPHLDEWQARSMMVGDTVQFGNKTYRCETYGWKWIKK
tara:strand:- start:534 stop:788 length:255 start_codon:yes stop_codon:yes gene_type:complete